jgi:peroxiredoxin
MIKSGKSAKKGVKSAVSERDGFFMEILMRIYGQFNPGFTGQRFFVPASLSLVTFCIVINNVLPASAGTKGDIELLRLVATAHQANRARIRTWQGRAQIEIVRADANSVIMRDKQTVGFFSDRSLDVTRWKWTHNERYIRKGLEIEGHPVPDTLLETVNAMTTRGGFYRNAPAITTREGQRLNTLVIWPPEKARRDSYSDCFDPMWYLTGHMTKCLDDLVERLAFLYRRVKNEGISDIIATRQGDLVFLQLGDERLLNRHTFDLSKDGNVVKYYAASDGGTEVREWTYEQIDGAWVPKTFVFSHDVKSPGTYGETIRTRKVSFVENILNQPIPVSQFSFGALEYHDGEQVTDQRPEKPSVYFTSGKWEQKLAMELQPLPPRAAYEELPPEFAEPLLGKPLPEFTGLDIDILSEQIAGRIILVCFFDMNQRPSRNCISQLAKQAEQLKEKGLTVVAVQTSKVDKNAINTWIEENKIPFAAGIIQDDEKKVRFEWGVKFLPWLILTDRNHIVTSEGFSVSEVGDKIK